MIFFQVLTNCINKSKVSRNLPDSLKRDNIYPILKTKDLLGKTNYNPVNILSHCQRYTRDWFLKNFSRYCHLNKIFDKLSLESSYHATCALQVTPVIAKALKNLGYVGTMLMKLAKILLLVSYYEIGKIGPW